MFFKKKEKIIVEEVKSESVEEPKIEEECVWIEGYKGTDKDMKCRDFQYELNNYYTHTDEVKLCIKRFHFCKDLNNVFDYYRLLNGNRFFKVKGLVKKSDYENINTHEYLAYGMRDYNDSKLAAKELLFLNELTFDDLKLSIQNKFPMIETEEEYYSCKDYNEFCKNKFLSGMKDLGFSELYSNMKYTKFMDNLSVKIFLDIAKAYQAEGISKDVMIYLLETR